MGNIFLKYIQIIIFFHIVVVNMAISNCRNNTLCVEGCELIRLETSTLPGHLDCVNITHSKPIFIPLSYPYSIFATNPNPEDNLALITTHYSYNITGSVCPYGCVLNSNNICSGISLPSNRSIICRYSQTLACPSNCRYDYLSGECLSNENNYICPLDIEIMCPFGCRPNMEGNKCVPNGEIGLSYPICEQLTYPLCKKGCEYNVDLSYCKAINNEYSPCESLFLARCDYPYFISMRERYTIDITKLVNCSSNNAIDICYDNQYGILFPERLKTKYINYVKCKYSILSCNEKGCSTGTCPIVTKVCCDP